MNPVIWFEELKALVLDHFTLSNEIHRLVDEAKHERDVIMSNLDKLAAAVADLEAKVAAFTVPVAEDDSAEADALAERVTKATGDLEAKVASPVSGTPNV